MPATILSFPAGRRYELLGPVLTRPYLDILFGEPPTVTPLTICGWNQAGHTELSCAAARARPAGQPGVLVWQSGPNGLLRVLDHVAGESVLGLACDNHPDWPRGYNISYMELTLDDLAPDINCPDLPHLLAPQGRTVASG